MNTSTYSDSLLAERFSSLPEQVQNAILSADIEKKLQGLAGTHKLHLDQWQVLENEVMLALLGIKSPNELQTNIEKELNLTAEIASALTNDISKAIFEPVREELERELDHPKAKEEVVSDLEQARTELLAEAKHDGATIPQVLPKVDFSTMPSVTPTPSIAPTTPPSTKPETKSDRGPAQELIVAGPSTERKTVVNDPYREQP